MALLRQDSKFEKPSPALLRKELEFVLGHSDPGEAAWFLVDKKWLKRWGNFVKGDGPHPGPITNNQLLDVNTNFQTVNRPLKVGIDIQAVSEEVWDYLIGRYGGGPAITTVPRNDRILERGLVVSHEIAEPPKPRCLYDDSANRMMEEEVLKGKPSPMSSPRRVADRSISRGSRNSESPDSPCSPSGTGSRGLTSSLTSTAKSIGSVMSGLVSPLHRPRRMVIA